MAKYADARCLYIGLLIRAENFNVGFYLEFLSQDQKVFQNLQDQGYAVS